MAQAYKNVLKVFIIDALDGFYQVSLKQFDFTAKPLVTNTVVITRVLCINMLKPQNAEKMDDIKIK